MRAGQDPARFPDFTLREICCICDAMEEQEVERARLQAHFNGYAFHDPNNIPDPIKDGAERTESEKRSDLDFVRGWMRAKSEA